MHRALNHTAHYAVMAATFLAQCQEERATAALIAERLELPRNYLGKVLHAMAQAGLVVSTRGPHGGFRLSRPADRITLAQVTEPFMADTELPVWWRQASDQTNSFLSNTTLQMLVDAQRANANGGSHVKQPRTR